MLLFLEVFLVLVALLAEVGHRSEIEVDK